MPVWHVSISVWSSDRATKRNEPLIARAEAVKLLRGVGGDREWWIWNRQARIGHLRVAVTAEENARVPAGVATDDAGESGPERPRSR